MNEREDIEKTLEWFGIPTAWIAIPAAIAAAVAIALQIHSHLTDPLFRWVALGIVALLCVLGIIFGKRPTKRMGFVQKETASSPFPHFLPYACGLVISGTLLSFDLYFNLRSYRSPIEVGPLSYLPSERVAVTKEGTSLLKGVKSLGLMSESADPRIWVGNGFDFDLRKKDKQKEVVIQDIVVTVDRIEELPACRRYPAAAAQVDVTWIFIDMQKQKEPPPWTFRATRYYTNHDGLVDWKDGRLSLQDAFRMPIRVILVGHDEGIFCITAKIILSQEIGFSQELTLIEKPTCFGFLGTARGGVLRAGPQPPGPQIMNLPIFEEVDDLKDVPGIDSAPRPPIRKKQPAAPPVIDAQPASPK